MPRTTIGDRARKARIRQRELSRLRKQLQKLEAITPAQIKTLRKVQQAMDAGDPLQSTAVPDWRDLREMGVVREFDGLLVLTTIGSDVLDSEDEA
jgi:hypothetical protein